MWASLLRLGLTILSGIIALRLFKRSKSANRRKTWRKYVIIEFCIVILINCWMFENLFVTFPSPEAVFHYMHIEDIEFVLEGEYSAYIYSWDSDKERCGTTAVRSEKGWKICQGRGVKHVETQYVEGVFVRIKRYRETQDYYLSVFKMDGEKMNIQDNRKSNFICSENRKDGGHSYYAYVNNYNDQYQLFVNGKVLEWE